jgi:heterodisulfide reductase subunit B
LPRPAKPDYEPLPIFYFTELMALAYGLPMKKVLGKHLVSPKPLLGRLGIV